MQKEANLTLHGSNLQHLTATLEAVCRQLVCIGNTSLPAAANTYAELQGTHQWLQVLKPPQGQPPTDSHCLPSPSAAQLGPRMAGEDHQLHRRGLSAPGSRLGLGLGQNYSCTVLI